MSSVHLERETLEPGWARPIWNDLELVERVLEASAASDVGVASELANHLFAAGGKRIRPALVILSARALGADRDSRIVELAAATELVHTASLVHDDVVDQARFRRGVCTASAKWGNRLSVLGGDFLLARAFALLTEVGNP